MNTLPNEIQDVIHTYKSQMEFGEVIKDLNRRPVLPYDCFGCQISKRNSVSRKTKHRLNCLAILRPYWSLTGAPIGARGVGHFGKSENVSEIVCIVL